MVLAPGRDLADEHRAEHAAVGAEHDGREVLGHDRPARSAAAVADGRERRGVAAVGALGHDGRASARTRPRSAGP